MSKNKNLFIKGLIKGFTEREGIEFKELNNIGTLDTVCIPLPKEIITNPNISQNPVFALKNIVNYIKISKIMGQVPVVDENKIESLTMVGYRQLSVKSLFDTIEYNAKIYTGIFEAPNSYCDDLDNILSYIEKVVPIQITKTENDIIIKKIDLIPEKQIILDKGTEEQSIKNFFETLTNENIRLNAFAYMSLDMYDFLEKIPNLIKENPFVKNGKMICKTPIIVLPNYILKTIDSKSKLFYGNLKNYLTLFSMEDYKIEKTNETQDCFRKSVTEFRVTNYYDCLEVYKDSIICGEINLI